MIYKVIDFAYYEHSDEISIRLFDEIEEYDCRYRLCHDADEMTIRGAKDHHAVDMILRLELLLRAYKLFNALYAQRDACDSPADVRDDIIGKIVVVV